MDRPMKDPALASRLREVVEAIGTQQAAADRVGVSLAQVKRYLQGRSRPSLKVAADLASAGGFAIEYVLTGKGPKTLQESISEGARDAEPGEDIRDLLALRFRAACDVAGIPQAVSDPDAALLVDMAFTDVMSYPRAYQLHLANSVAEAHRHALLYGQQRALRRVAGIPAGSGRGGSPRGGR